MARLTQLALAASEEALAGAGLKDTAINRERTGVIDIAGAAFKELTLLQMSYRLSDHFPLWVEFTTDRSREHMARTLGADPAMPDPFDSVPD